MSCVSPAPGAVACVRGGPHMRALQPCPEEGGRVRRMVVSYASPMYGSDTTCLGCGAEEQDGVWLAGPDRWSPEDAERAVQRWRAAIPAEEYRAFVQADLDAWMAAS
jgi:hypothetical protein